MVEMDNDIVHKVISKKAYMEAYDNIGKILEDNKFSVYEAVGMLEAIKLDILQGDYNE